MRFKWLRLPRGAAQLRKEKLVSYIDITMNGMVLMSAVAVTLHGNTVTHKAGEPETGCPGVSAIATQSVIGCHNGVLDDDLFDLFEASLA